MPLNSLAQPKKCKLGAEQGEDVGIMSRQGISILANDEPERRVSTAVRFVGTYHEAPLHVSNIFKVVAAKADVQKSGMFALLLEALFWPSAMPQRSGAHRAFQAEAIEVSADEDNRRDDP